MNRKKILGHVLPGMVYSEESEEIERNIISIELKSIPVDKRGAPTGANKMPIYEIRANENQFGNPFDCRLIVNKSDDSEKAIEIMERLNVSYSIIWQIGKKEIPTQGSIKKQIPMFPLPSLYISNDRWFLGIKNIAYYIKLIAAIIPSGTYELEKVNKEAEKISKEAKEKYGTPPGLYPGFEPGLLAEAGWWMVDL